MNVLIVTAGHSLFDAKGQLNSYLAYLTENYLGNHGYEVKFSDTTKHWDAEREVEKLLWADCIIYIVPIMWFNMPAPMVRWLNEVLIYKRTFVITDEYGEGGLLKANQFMIVTTSNMKRTDLGNCYVLRNTDHIDGVLQPLIMTSEYLNVRQQLPTFHADNVIAGDTQWIKEAYLAHLSARLPTIE